MTNTTSPITWEHQAGLAETALAAAQKAVEQVALLWASLEGDGSTVLARRVAAVAEAVDVALEEAENAFAAADGKALSDARNNAWAAYGYAQARAAAFTHRDECREAADKANQAYWLDEHETPEDSERDMEAALAARAARDLAEEVCEAYVIAAEVRIAAWTNA